MEISAYHFGYRARARVEAVCKLRAPVPLTALNYFDRTLTNIWRLSTSRPFMSGHTLVDLQSAPTVQCVWFSGAAKNS